MGLIGYEKEVPGLARHDIRCKKKRPLFQGRNI